MAYNAPSPDGGSGGYGSQTHTYGITAAGAAAARRAMPWAVRRGQALPTHPAQQARNDWMSSQILGGSTNRTGSLPNRGSGTATIRPAGGGGGGGGGGGHYTPPPPYHFQGTPLGVGREPDRTPFHQEPDKPPRIIVDYGPGGPQNPANPPEPDAPPPVTQMAAAPAGSTVLGNTSDTQTYDNTNPVGPTQSVGRDTTDPTGDMRMAQYKALQQQQANLGPTATYTAGRGFGGVMN